MGLRLHNTLTRTKEDFRPIDPQNIRMYVCGPTVYDFAHIGNARPLIVFDVLFRLLRHLYGEAHVTYVRNITDVDDKINARAAEEYPNLPLNEAIREVTSKTEKQFHEDVAALGCLPPTREPRATEHIAEMRAMIEKLVEKGFAYVAEDHVLFHVAAMKDYGKLSNRSLDEMIAGARVEVAPYKKDATDFVLWKPSKQEARSEATGKREGGEPSWPSPVGIKTPGRPGWHLECSAMSDRWLWQEARAALSEAGIAHPHQFDIHGGGIDLVFPHHENEIAQSRCAFGTPAMANYWLHNGFLQVEGEKMSKSLGNFVTIRELLNSPRLAIIDPTSEQLARNRARNGLRVRLAMLMTHYRSPMDWTDRKQGEATAKLAEWSRAARGFEPGHLIYPSEVIDALSDDLNTHEAIAAVDGYAKVANGPSPSNESVQAVAGSMHLLGFESGLGGLADDGKLSEAIEASYKALVDKRLADRAAARKAKNFAEADRIRAELDAMGIALKDSKDPTTGELVTTWEVKR
jgi:cysteinyl-tRNA synthetase